MTSRSSAPDTILNCGNFTTLDRRKPTASAVAIIDGAFTAVGEEYFADTRIESAVISLIGRGSEIVLRVTRDWRSKTLGVA
jgi:predicted amidohydrolase YtcJ